MNSEDAIAAFLAKGGKITKVDTGARALDEKTIRDLAHGNDNKRAEAQAKIGANSERDGYAEFEKAQQEAWLDRYEGRRAEE